MRSRAHYVYPKRKAVDEHFDGSDEPIQVTFKINGEPRDFARNSASMAIHTLSAEPVRSIARSYSGLPRFSRIETEDLPIRNHTREAARPSVPP